MAGFVALDLTVRWLIADMDYTRIRNGCYISIKVPVMHDLDYF